MFSRLFVGRFVCLFVYKISQKVLDEFCDKEQLIRCWE